jgi:hypothetical protein
MDSPFAPPPPPPGKSERDEFLQARLFEELAARDRLNRDTDERTARFIAAAREDVCYDPVFVEFFTRSQQRIADLRERLERVRRGGLTERDIEDTKARVASVLSLLGDQPESLSRHIAAIEQKTQILQAKTIPAAIAMLEREVVQNRTLQKRFMDADVGS